MRSEDEPKAPDRVSVEYERCRFRSWSKVGGRTSRERRTKTLCRVAKKELNTHGLQHLSGN